MTTAEHNEERTDTNLSESVIRQDLLEILVCPLGKAPLRLEGDTLICTRCGLTYRIEDGIPNMLIDEAKLPEGVDNVETLACNPGQGESAE